MPGTSRRRTRADVLILCALPEELSALTNLPAAGGWQPKHDASGYPYHLADFADLDGRLMRIAAARAADMGSTDAAAIAAILNQELEPRCLAMCGICAGRRDEVFLGDIIIADRLFRYDGGKLKRLRGRRGRREERILEDIQTYNLAKNWKVEAEAFGSRWSGAATAQLRRPLSLTYQERWLLDQLARHVRDGGLPPQDSPERKAQCPRWRDVVERARKHGFISQHGLHLCEKGSAHLDELRLQYLDGFPPSDPPFATRVGALGTGEKVIVDTELFQRLEDVERKILGIDMESQAIGVVASYGRIKHSIVVKAVQDYADPDKDDAFRSFAAEVSARFLIDFLLEHLPRARGAGSATSVAVARVRPGPGRPRRGPSPGAGFYSDYYVARPAEERDILLELDRRKPVVIWGPLGFGKTWLLKRIYMAAESDGCRLVKLSSGTLDSADTLNEFLRLLAEAIVSAVGGEADWIDSVWSGLGGAKAKLGRLMEARILPCLPKKLVIGIDQVDGLMTQPYCKDFFYLLRDWCERSGEPPWDSLRLILTISTLPSRMSARFRNSPFNKASNISLREFDEPQLGQLAASYGCQASPAELELLKRETAGHPLLASIAFYEIVQRGGSFSQALADSSLFSSYLGRLREELSGKEALRDAWRSVRRSPGVRVAADLAEDLLRAGLVHQRGRRLWPRCSLYERYPGW